MPLKFTCRRKSNVLFLMLIFGSIVFLFSSLQASDEGHSKYYYHFKGQSVGMIPSDSLVVVQETRSTKGAGVLEDFSDFDLVLDPLNGKLSEQDKGIKILRLPQQRQSAKGGVASREQVKKKAEEDSYIYQPVFEQGQAIFIPTAEVLVGFKNPTSEAEAAAFFAGSGRELGVIDSQNVGNNLYRITIDNPGDGRCYEVSRRVSEMSEVDFAEPNHLIILLDQNDTSNLLIDDSLLDMEFRVQGPGFKAMRGGTAEQNVSSGLASNWEVVASLNGEESVFPPAGWEVRKKNSAAHVFWGVTDFQKHSGNHSVYCAGSGNGAVQAPGPAPVNMYTALLSPQMDLSSFQEIYVEVWFYSKNEIIKDANGRIVSGDFSLLVVTDGKNNSVSPLFVGYVGDATIDPTTKNGWRKLLYRVEPSFKANPVRLMFTYTSNSTQQFEGVYLDDIRVIASVKVVKNSLENDPYSGNQYELKNTGQIAGQGNESNDMNVVEAWREVEVSPSVIVAVIDDGVDLNHPDLNIITGYNADGSIGGGPGSESSNHGTSVAGNVGAIGKNGIGVIGTAPNVKIMPINFGGSSALDFANAIDTAVKNGAHILNNSWGFNGAHHRVIELAILRALDAGRIVLFAAGNGPDRPPYNYNVFFPGSMTGSTDVITVGASSQTDEHKSASSTDGQFSWGSSYRGDGPDVCAPGPWSYTTDKVGKLGYNSGSSGIHPDYHHNFGGTSASTPKVAGIVALMLSANIHLTPAQVKRILKESADDIDEPGFDDKTGAGRVNAQRAVQMAMALNRNSSTPPEQKRKTLPDNPERQQPIDDDGFQKVLDW